MPTPPDDSLQKLLKVESQPGCKKKVARRKDPKIDVTRLDDASESELVAICRAMGFDHATRQLPRDELMALILGQREVPEDPLRSIRERTYAYVKGNERVLASLLTCDRFCPGCPHRTVVDCYTTNQDLVD